MFLRLALVRSDEDDVDGYKITVDNTPEYFRRSDRGRR
jgi:hypothetical protein